MAFLKNAAPVSAAEACFLFKRTLNVGTSGTNWTVPTSSTGIVYAAQGDVITSAASLAAPGAWFVLRGRPFVDVVDPNTELCVQVDAVGGVRLKWSPRAGFTGGSPNLVRTPSAADEIYLLGGGTDASPTYSPLWPSSGSRMQGYASEDDERCWFLSYAVGTGAPTALFFIDRPQPNPRGKGGNLLDRERIVFYAATGAGCVLCDTISADPAAPRSLFRYATPEQLWGRCPPGMLYQLDGNGDPQRYVPGGASTSLAYPTPTTPELPFIYARRAALAGTLLPGEVGDANTCDEKGTSQMIRYGGLRRSSPVLLDAVNPDNGCAETGATLALGDVLLNWDGASLLV